MSVANGAGSDVGRSGRVLEQVRDERGSQKIWKVLSVVKHNGNFLRLATNKVRDDEETAKTAVERHGHALGHRYEAGDGGTGCFLPPPLPPFSLQ